MKRALVFSLIFALGIGVAGFAGAFTGDWDSRVCVDFDGAGNMSLDSFYSTLYVDYAVSGWVFGSNFRFTNVGLDKLWFDAAGNFGAFSFTSAIEFDPILANFSSWENIVEVSIAGVNFYGLFVMDWISEGVIGVGSAFGALATAGDIDIAIEVQFGAGDGLHFVRLWGVQGWYGISDGYQSCLESTYYILAGNGFATSCDPGFTGLDVYVSFPFTCLDVTVFGGFSCDVGFESVSVLLENIDIGAGWFAIDSMMITFQTAGKTICLDLDLTIGDAICVTPYLTLMENDGTYVDDSPYQISGVSLNALTLSYNYNGVTFKAGELFTHSWERNDSYLTGLVCGPLTGFYVFTKTGGITRTTDCAFMAGEIYPNEFFGITIDGDSCCGGGFNVDIYNFLYAGGDDGEFGIFGWVGTYAAVSVDIGTAFTLGASTTVTYEGMDQLCFNFGFSW